MTHAKFLAAAVQHESVLHDAAAGLDKALAIIDEAAAAGVRLLAFPEAWLPGYPYWAWLGPPAWGMQFVQAYHDNSLQRDGKELESIGAAAKRHGMHIVFGYSERQGGTLYLAQSLFGPEGEVIAHRRKLRPTHVERSVFGEGDGSSLAVHDTALGRLGALCCWEHLQPLSKYAMYSMHEQVHVAAWPTFSLYPGKAYALGEEANMAASQVYALEGQCFVLAATSMVTAATLDAMQLDEQQRQLLLPGGGCSTIFAPDGRPLSERLPGDAEGLVTAEIDLAEIALAKAAADPVGHYARPDVTRLWLNTQPSMPVQAFDPGLSNPAAQPGDGGAAGPPLSESFAAADGSAEPTESE